MVVTGKNFNAIESQQIPDVQRTPDSNENELNQIIQQQRLNQSKPQKIKGRKVKRHIKKLNDDLDESDEEFLGYDSNKKRSVRTGSSSSSLNKSSEHLSEDRSGLKFNNKLLNTGKILTHWNDNSQRVLSTVDLKSTLERTNSLINNFINVGFDSKSLKESSESANKPLERWSSNLIEEVEEEIENPRMVKTTNPVVEKKLQQKLLEQKPPIEKVNVLLPQKSMPVKPIAAEKLEELGISEKSKEIFDKTLANEAPPVILNLSSNLNSWFSNISSATKIAASATKIAASATMTHAAKQLVNAQNIINANLAIADKFVNDEENQPKNFVENKNDDWDNNWDDEPIFLAKTKKINNQITENLQARNIPNNEEREEESQVDDLEKKTVELEQTQIPETKFKIEPKEIVEKDIELSNNDGWGDWDDRVVESEQTQIPVIESKLKSKEIDETENQMTNNDGWNNWEKNDESDLAFDSSNGIQISEPKLNSEIITIEINNEGWDDNWNNGNDGEIENESKSNLSNQKLSNEFLQNVEVQYTEIEVINSNNDDDWDDNWGEEEETSNQKQSLTQNDETITRRKRNAEFGDDAKEVEIPKIDDSNSILNVEQNDKDNDLDPIDQTEQTGSNIDAPKINQSEDDIPLICVCPPYYPTSQQESSVPENQDFQLDDCNEPADIDCDAFSKVLEMYPDWTPPPADVYPPPATCSLPLDAIADFLEKPSAPPAEELETESFVQEEIMISSLDNEIVNENKVCNGSVPSGWVYQTEEPKEPIDSKTFQEVPEMTEENQNSHQSMLSPNAIDIDESLNVQIENENNLPPMNPPFLCICPPYIPPASDVIVPPYIDPEFRQQPLGNNFYEQMSYWNDISQPTIKNENEDSEMVEIDLHEDDDNDHQIETLPEKNLNDLSQVPIVELTESSVLETVNESSLKPKVDEQSDQQKNNGCDDCRTIEEPIGSKEEIKEKTEIETKPVEKVETNKPKLNIVDFNDNSDDWSEWENCNESQLKVGREIIEPPIIKQKVSSKIASEESDINPIINVLEDVKEKECSYLFEPNERNPPIINCWDEDWQNSETNPDEVKVEEIHEKISAKSIEAQTESVSKFSLLNRDSAVLIMNEPKETDQNLHRIVKKSEPPLDDGNNDDVETNLTNATDETVDWNDWNDNKSEPNQISNLIPQVISEKEFIGKLDSETKLEPIFDNIEIKQDALVWNLNESKETDLDLHEIGKTLESLDNTGWDDWDDQGGNNETIEVSQKENKVIPEHKSEIISDKIEKPEQESSIKEKPETSKLEIVKELTPINDNWDNWNDNDKKTNESDKNSTNIEPTFILPKESLKIQESKIEKSENQNEKKTLNFKSIKSENKNKSKFVKSESLKQDKFAVDDNDWNDWNDDAESTKMSLTKPTTTTSDIIKPKPIINEKKTTINKSKLSSIGNNNRPKFNLVDRFDEDNSKCKSSKTKAKFARVVDDWNEDDDWETSSTSSKASTVSSKAAESSKSNIQRSSTNSRINNQTTPSAVAAILGPASLSSQQYRQLQSSSSNNHYQKVQSPSSMQHTGGSGSWLDDIKTATKTAAVTTVTHAVKNWSFNPISLLDNVVDNLSNVVGVPSAEEMATVMRQQQGKRSQNSK